MLFWYFKVEQKKPGKYKSKRKKTQVSGMLGGTYGVVTLIIY